MISTDRARLDLRFIHDYLSIESYWGKGIPYEKVVAAADHSLNFGLYHQGGGQDGGNDPGGQDEGNGRGRQVGYARILTDYARVAYLADVFIISEHRGRGLAKWLMESIMAHPGLQGLRRWMLHTMDAHGLYEQFGWRAAAKPETYLEVYNPDERWWEG